MMTENAAFALPAEGRSLRQVSLILLALALLAVGANVHYLLGVVPEYRDMFADWGNKLPSTALFVLGISPFLVWVAAGLLGVCLLAKEFLVRPRLAMAWNIIALAAACIGYWFASTAMSALIFAYNQSLHSLQGINP